MYLIHIKSNIRDYDVCFSKNGAFFDELTNLPNNLFIVDENVWRIYSQNLLSVLQQKEVIILPIHEDLKNLDTVQKIYDQLLEKSAKRNLTIIAIGGGILQDIVGFVCSTLYRGINWYFVPTTLLAQSDSCIGSKTSLNYKSYKNLIGTFYPPTRVFIHVPMLLSLPSEFFFSGLGEVIKLHLMGGQESANVFLSIRDRIMNLETDALEQAINSALNIKINFMTGDEFDLGRRNMLNFGHCFGHALESASNFEIPHGQAVVVGMLFANFVSLRRGILSQDLHEFLKREFLMPGLIIKLRSSQLASNKIVEGMKKDKKRTGKGLTLIMLQDGFEMVRVDNLEEAEVEQGVEFLKELFL
jgi:3-dehydroquinate synthase